MSHSSFFSRQRQLGMALLVAALLSVGSAGAQQAAPTQAGLQSYDVELLIFRNLSGKETPESWGVEAANDAASDDVKAYAKKNVELRFDWLNKQLTGKQYLTGDTFTIADAYLFVVANWSNFVGIDLSKWPALQAFQGRVAARPKVQEALEAEGLTKKAA